MTATVSNLPVSARRLRRAILAFALICIVVGISFGGRAERHGTSDSPFGAYAGYVWRGRVMSVGGSWTVPRIVSPSRSGLATTWLGAQASGDSGAFIQIGVAELHEATRVQTNDDRYWAFWSDSTRQFRLQFLFRVKPDDALSASLILAHERWELSIMDHTSGFKAQFYTTEDARPLFDEAQWTQEDARAASGERYPYPSLSRVDFRRLAVNSAAPAYTSLYSTWMSIDDTALAPTPLAGAAFSLKRETVHAAGTLYLRIDALRSMAARAFGSELERWTSDTPRGVIATSSSRFIASLRDYVRALAAAPLPRAASNAVRLFVRRLDLISNRAHPPTVITPLVLQRWRASLDREAEAALYVSHILRRLLGLPELA